MKPLFLIIIMAISAVGAAQNPPVFGNDNFSHHSLGIHDTLTLSPLANDFDADGDTLSIINVVVVSEGIHFAAKTSDTTIDLVLSLADAPRLDTLRIIIREKGTTTKLHFDTLIIDVRTSPNWGVLRSGEAAGGIQADGTLFFDGESAAYAVPRSGLAHMMFAGQIWMGGYHGGQLHASAATYGQLGSPRFYPGPIGNNYDSAHFDRYNRVWQVSASLIDTHIVKAGAGGYVMPWVIEHWPAHGVAANGEAALLAPFVDVNNNGMYEPALGEYPDNRGCDMLFAMFNDEGGRDTGDLPGLGMEVHLSVYSYDGGLGHALDHTVFVDYNIINRSQRTYAETRLGHFMDMDIGGFDDDLLACEMSRSLLIGYNGDNDDAAYGMDPPALGIRLLNAQMSGTVYYNNDFSLAGNPEVDSHYYNYIDHRFKDGSAIPGICFDERQSSNTPGDRRAVMTRSLGSWAPADTIHSTLGFIYARRPGHDHLQNITAVELMSDTVQMLWNAGLPVGGCSKIGTAVRPVAACAYAVYPNPGRGRYRIEGCSASEVQIGVYDGAGRLVHRGSDKMLDIAHLPGGTYWLRISGSDGQQVIPVQQY